MRRLDGRFRADLEADPLYHKYRKCLEHGDASACRAPLSDALYAVASRSLEPFVADEATELLRRSAGDRAGMHAYLQSVVAGTRDPVRGMVALNLLRLAGRGAFPLPESVYGGIVERPDPEIQLILGGHEGLALPETAKDEVAALVLDPAIEPGVRFTALRAFGPGDDDPEYIDAFVDAYVDGDRAASVLGYRELPAALARCGDPCTSRVLELSVSDSATVRGLAQQVLAFVSESKQASLAREIARLSPGG